MGIRASRSDGAMSEFELTNRLAPVVPTVGGEIVADVVAPMTPETLAAVNSALVDVENCDVCAVRTVAIAKMRAAMETCPCRAAGV
jgi:hypothetical protein